MKARQNFSSDLQAVQRQLERWRRTRTHRERIPEALWQKMTQVAEVHGVSRVARALGVDFYSLRERVRTGTSSPQSTDGNEFVEVTAPPSTLPSEGIVELENAKGSKMTLRLPPGQGLDVLALVETFLNGRRP